MTTSLSIMDLPGVLTQIFERAQRPLLPGPFNLFVRYLRRKPGRGLAVIYSVDDSSHRPHSNDPNRAVSLTLDEQALDGARIRFSAVQAEQATLEIQPSGVLRVPSLGLSVQAFPADGSLPALAASCDTTPQSPLLAALQEAAQRYLDDPAWHIISACAQPVRYKPANRCVIRYSLLLEHPQLDGEASERTVTIFGKVYADVAQAVSVQHLQQQLYTEQQEKSEDSPLLPCPLGMVETLGLTLNEAIQPHNAASDGHWSELRTGTRALQPQLEHGTGGAITKVTLPHEELCLTAEALARLHTSTVQPTDGMPRTGTKEAKRAKERAALIAERNPTQAQEVQHLVQQLASQLATLQPESYRPAHGGFKSSQLLFHSHRVFVVDFDGFCLADAALDVGYFLAYLRPSGLWYNQLGMRQWFEDSAQVFCDAYLQAMTKHGVSHTVVDNIMNRSRLYEAALIFKIATRRVNRLNSPRSQELSAMLSEIALCLSDKGGKKS